MKQIALILMMLLTSVFIKAHGDEHEKKIIKKDTVTIVGKDTIAINGKPVNAQMNEKMKEEKASGHFELELFKQIFEHPHNKLIHFPIVLGLVAFGFSLLNRKNNKYEKAIFPLVIIGAIFSLASVLTGLNQAAPFIGTEKEWIVDYHRSAGILLLSGYLLWVLFLSIKSLKKHEWIFGFAVVLLILLTGFLGGVIAH